jgi:hypothetical protein
MYDPEIYSTIEGEPVVRVILNAAELGTIAMLMRKHAVDHTNNVRKVKESAQDRAWDAQGESHQAAGQWSALDDLLNDHFWRWTDEIPAPFPLLPKHQRWIDDDDNDVCNDCAHEATLTVVEDSDEG